MKTTIKFFTTFSILLNIGLLYLFVLKGNTVPSVDKRVAILMEKDHQTFVLAEMRDFLESVQQINEGIMTNSPDKIINAGNKSGGSVIDHAPTGLLKTLPFEFKQLGFETHDIFDKIATSAKEDYQPEKAQRQLNKLLNNCVACHQIYKIDAKQIVPKTN